MQKEALLDVWNDIIETIGISVTTGVTVTAVRPGDDGIFTLETSQGIIRAQRVILAMGRRGTPRKLEVPGEDQGKVAYRLIEAENYRDQHCLVVGGGDSAVEAAVALGKAGARVHLAHRRRIFDRIKSKNQQLLDAAVADRQVALLLEASVKEIKKKAVTVMADGRVVELPNDYVFVLVGGVLPTTFLKSAGVEIQTYTGQAYAPANLRA